MSGLLLYKDSEHLRQRDVWIVHPSCPKGGWVNESLYMVPGNTTHCPALKRMAELEQCLVYSQRWNFPKKIMLSRGHFIFDLFEKSLGVKQWGDRRSQVS